MEIGKQNRLKIIRQTPHGFYLYDGDQTEVLLPNRYRTEAMEIGDEIDVFVYTDSEDRLIATTEQPPAVADSFAVLEVRDINKFGAFLKFGDAKDLLVPYSEQPSPMEIGQSYLVYVYEDVLTERLVASAKWHKFLSQEEPDFEEGQEVDLIVARRTDLGFKVLINGAHEGMVYANEVFQPLCHGQQIKGFIHQLREDGKIDVRLQQSGYARVEPNAQKILDLLEQRGGFLPLTDKSKPEIIKAALNMSKRTFKQSIGKLYKERQIDIKKDGIYRVK